MPQMITRIALPIQPNWQKELAQAVTEPAKLLASLEIPEQSFSSGFGARKLFPLRVPLPFVARMKKGDPKDPLLLQVMTAADEFVEHPDYGKDPLSEQQTPLPGLLHKYKSRVLLMVRTGCAVNCRYCFRRHFPYQDNSPGKQGWQDVAAYIEQHPEINEVIFSGGDPLMANDQQLLPLIELLSTIPHLSRLRIHTRLPIVLPNRITDELVNALEASRLKVVVVTHINHANEIDQSVCDAMAKLTRAGVTLLNQAVLLKDINDSDTAQIALSERLFDAGILPYYLHLLDKVAGASHFDLPEADAVTIMHQLYSALPGFLVPRLVRELPSQPHKTPIDLGLFPGPGNICPPDDL